MTCIVGVARDKTVFIGGDSLATDSASLAKTLRADPKVFVKDGMIIGFCGSFRMGQIIRYAFKTPARPKSVSDLEYLIGTWVPALIDCFDKQGYSGDKPAESKDESKVGGNFLLGYKGVLYEIEDDYQVGIPMDNYASVGCGRELAMGSLFTSLRNPETDPKDIIGVALEAAEAFSAGVQKPFVILESK